MVHYVVDTQTYLDCNVQCCGLLSVEQIHVNITVHQQCRQILLFLSMMLELPLDYRMEDRITLKIEGIYTLIRSLEILDEFLGDKHNTSLVLGTGSKESQ